MKALIIYSGGMDSTVLLNKYKKDIKLAISFDYSSKHNDKEITSAIQNCFQLEINHSIISLPFVLQYFESGLLSGDIPEGHYEDESMKKTIVPFRNGIMLSIAVGIAESKGFDTVLIANHFGDHAIYPDCRKDFIEPMAEAIYFGTDEKVKLLAPFTDLTKRQIGVIGKKLNVDFSKTWSCYKGKDVHCGKCGTCIERIEALEGFDNTTYMRKR